MNDDELIADLRGTPPTEVMNDALFWARVQRDVSAQIARRRRRARIGSIAAVAAVAISLFVVRTHHASTDPVPIDALDSADGPEASLGVAIEELSDEEVARAVRNFPRGG